MISEFKNDSEELELYMINDHHTYMCFITPVMARLSIDHKNHVYNKQRAINLFYKVARAGRRNYNAELGRTGFNDACLYRVANELESSTHQEFELGNYVS